MSNLHPSDRKSRLEGWSEGAVSGDHAALISAAVDLITRYDSQGMEHGNPEIAEGIYDVSLAALDSGDANQVTLMKNWFTWLNRQSKSGAVPPIKVELPMQFAISRIEEEIKRTGHIGHHPSDILKGRPGIDARVITTGSNNSWHVSRDCKVTRVFGAKFMGIIPKSGPPILVGVQLNNGGDHFDVQGELIDQAGAQIGVRKSLIKGAEVSLADVEIGAA